MFFKPSTFSVLLVSGLYSSLSRIKLDNFSEISFLSSNEGVSSNLTYIKSLDSSSAYFLGFSFIKPLNSAFDTEISESEIELYGK